MPPRIPKLQGPSLEVIIVRLGPASGTGASPQPSSPSRTAHRLVPEGSDHSQGRELAGQSPERPGLSPREKASPMWTSFISGG